MSEILLQTKLFLPTLRPLLLPRPRLLAKMDSGSAGKLTLISAPAGFGKTTLAAYWLAARERPVAWLSLDENDSQPLRFFTYLIVAMQTAVPGLAADLAASLRSPNPPDETAIVPALLNELAGHKESFILVLDDYHLLTNDAVHHALTFLVDQLPPTVHLIITSREDPPLPLPRWRVRGQLSGITSADLRFTVDEAAAFLQETMGLSLPATAVADLEARTEGWAAALQLAALSLRGAPDAARIIASFSGSERQVAGYLLQEVLLQQPQPVQAFLLQTSILERYNAPLCNALLERQDSQEILDQLEQNNLFTIPLDHERFWYRYHHLFADLLRYRLRRDLPPDAVAALHRRASRWYAGEGLLEEAIAHAFQIPDYDEVARLLAALPMHYIFIDGGSMRILQWAKKLPPDTVAAHAYVAALIAGAAMINGEGKIAYQHIPLVEADRSVQHFSDLFHSIIVRNESADYGRALRLAQSALAGAADGEDIFAPMAWAQIAVNYYNLGQLEEADEAIIAMRRAIPDEGLAAQTMQLQAIDLQVMTAVAQGSLQLAERRCLEGIGLAGEEGGPRLAFIGLMYANLASIYYQWNEIQRAEESVEIALDWAGRTGVSDIITYSATTLCSLACYHGDEAALSDALDLLSARVGRMRLARIDALLDQTSAWFWLQIGRLDRAVNWADAAPLSLDDDPAYHDFYLYQTLLATRFAQSRRSGDRSQLPRLLNLSRKLEKLVVSARHVTGLVETLTLQALILDVQGDPSAVQTAQKALDLARPGQMLRLFLDWGAPMQRLLKRVTPPHAEFYQRIMRAFDQELEPAAPPSPPIQLTSREAEILALIAAGLSNKQIEETLFISKNTVRTHIKNLYSKLDVTSRTQAINRARELQLLE